MLLASYFQDPVALSLNFHDYVPVSERVEKSPGKYLIDKTKHRASGESSSSDNDYQEMDQSSDTDTESASEEDTHKDIAETVDVKPKPPDNTDNPKGSVVPQKLYSNLHNVDTHNLAVYGKNVEMKEEFASDSETARDILNEHTGSDVHNEPDTDSETANDILNEHTARDLLNEHTDRDILNEPDSDSETARDIRNEHTARDICNENNTNPGKVGDEQEIGFTDVEMKEELVSDSETSTDNLNEHITKSNEHAARDIFNEKTARDILNENNINTGKLGEEQDIGYTNSFRNKVRIWW